MSTHARRYTYVDHWRAEARRFRADAADSFSPSMRQRIDMAALYKRVRRIMPDTIDGLPPLPVSTVCPVTLDEMASAEEQKKRPDLAA